MKKTIGLLLFLAASVIMGTAITVAIQWVVSGSLSTVWAWLLKYPSYFLMTVLLYSLAICTLGAWTRRLWVSGILISFAGLALALVDYFKNAINGTPLELMDFGLASKLGQVAGVAGELHLPSDFWWASLGLLLCIIILFFTQTWTGLMGKMRFCTALISSAAILITCSSIGAAMIGNLFGVDVYTRISPASNHNTYGLTLSLWRDCFRQSKQGPENYSSEQMQDVLTRIDEILAANSIQNTNKNTNASSKSPNIIMILSESFFDLNRLPGLHYEQDPLENFNTLKEEGISGKFHSHYLGYGTGYIEMSMLYGLNSLDLGPGANICFLEDELYQRFDALPEQYTRADYCAEMLHGFDNSLYNRTVTYPLLGFSNLFFVADLENQTQDWQGSVYGGYYLKDSFLFHNMLRRMRAINQDGQSAFLYGITMENHQPFDAEKFDYACQINVTDESNRLNSDDMQIVRVMLEGITRADQALGTLTDALREYPEPTIIVFFGDHRPNLFMNDGDTVYTKLGLCPDNDTTRWTIDQIDDLYSTDYLIWANQPELLGNQAGSRQDSSITAIGPQLLDLTNQSVTRYWALLEQVKQVCLTDTDLYFVDGNGSAYLRKKDAGLSPEAQELLDLREAVIYDAIYGNQYITDQMNQVVY